MTTAYTGRQWSGAPEFDVIDDEELEHLVRVGSEFESGVLRIVDHLIEKARTD